MTLSKQKKKYRKQFIRYLHMSYAYIYQPFHHVHLPYGSHCRYIIIKYTPSVALYNLSITEMGLLLTLIHWVINHSQHSNAADIKITKEMCFKYLLHIIRLKRKKDKCSNLIFLLFFFDISVLLTQSSMCDEQMQVPSLLCGCEQWSGAKLKALNKT